MIIGSIIIEKVHYSDGQLRCLSFMDLEDPGYEYREYSNGAKAWFKNGSFHREDGPAIIWSDGTEKWLRNGKFHREDGPAITYPNGMQSWYLDGKNYPERIFLK